MAHFLIDYTGPTVVVAVGGILVIWAAVLSKRG
jgi:hypothetical protein